MFYSIFQIIINNLQDVNKSEQVPGFLIIAFDVIRDPTTVMLKKH